ncbi:MAG: hypothetical protein ACTSW1_18930 [Candidatus Hodarchaeales archaeon]
MSSTISSTINICEIFFPDVKLIDGVWYTVNGSEIGPVIWGSFAIIQEVESGVGATYVSSTNAEFGYY